MLVKIKNMLSDIKTWYILGITSLFIGTPVLADDDFISGLGINSDGTAKGLPSNDGQGIQEAGTRIIEIGKTVISIITALAAIVLVAVGIIKAVNLGKSGDNPSERQRCIQGIIFVFIGAAVCGSISVFMGVFWGALN